MYPPWLLIPKNQNNHIINIDLKILSNISIEPSKNTTNESAYWMDDAPLCISNGLCSMLYYQWWPISCIRILNILNFINLNRNEFLFNLCNVQVSHNWQCLLYYFYVLHRYDSRHAQAARGTKRYKEGNMWM